MVPCFLFELLLTARTRNSSQFSLILSIELSITIIRKFQTLSAEPDAFGVLELQSGLLQRHNE